MLHKHRHQCNFITNFLNRKLNSLVLKSQLLALTWSVGKVPGCGVSQCWDNEISGEKEGIFWAVHGLSEFTNHSRISELLEESTNKHCQDSQTKVMSGLSTSLCWVPITVSVCHLGLEDIQPWGMKYVLSNTSGEVLEWLFRAVLTRWDWWAFQRVVQEWSVRCQAGVYAPRSMLLGFLPEQIRTCKVRDERMLHVAPRREDCRVICALCRHRSPLFRTHPQCSSVTFWQQCQSVIRELKENSIVSKLQDQAFCKAQVLFSNGGAKRQPL